MSHAIEDLTSSILDFQANIMRCILRKKMSPVDPFEEPKHQSLLQNIWASSKVEEAQDSEGRIMKWRLLGFDSEDVSHEFESVGVLGLECLVRLYNGRLSANMFIHLFKAGLCEIGSRLLRKSGSRTIESPKR